MPPPEFIDVRRRADGTADWKENFDCIYDAWNSARMYFERRQNSDRVLIDYLVRQRLAARRARDFSRADEIRDILTKAGVELTDIPNGTGWRVIFSAESGAVLEAE